MGHVSVHILDLREVLLRHVHKLGGAHLVGKPRETLVKGRRVIVLVVVLLTAEQQQQKTIRDSEKDNKVSIGFMSSTAFCTRNNVI